MSPTAVPPFSGTLPPPPPLTYQQPQFSMYQGTGVPPPLQSGYGLPFDPHSPGVPLQRSPSAQQHSLHPAAYGSYTTEPVEVRHA